MPDRKRLEVAKALALDPEVLLLDEVMAGLNATEIDEALHLLRDVNGRGVTLIVVEHLMKAIVSISTTIVVLAEGKKIAEGAPAEVLAIGARDRSVLGHALRRTPAAGSRRNRDCAGGRAARRTSRRRLRRHPSFVGCRTRGLSGRDRRDHRLERRRQVDVARRDQRPRADVGRFGDVRRSET